MTNEEMLEAFEKVRADITEDLSAIAACVEADNLADIVEEKTRHMFTSLQQLAALLWSTAPEPRDFLNGRAGSVSRLISSVEMGMILIYAPTQTLNLPPDKAKLIKAEAQQSPRIRSTLNEIAEYLRKIASESKAPRND